MPPSLDALKNSKVSPLNGIMLTTPPRNLTFIFVFEDRYEHKGSATCASRSSYMLLLISVNTTTLVDAVSKPYAAFPPIKNIPGNNR